MYSAMPTLLLSSALAAAAASASATVSTAAPDPFADPSQTYNFLALADWGEDNAGQYATAKGLGDMAVELNATQVFVLGDNFYSSGIHTPADGPDGMYRFKKTFEDVYTAPSLQNIPFHVIAGNHDHYGNASAQIAYTANAQNKGGRWNFPNWYHNVSHTFEVQGKQVELEVLLFDSVVMVGNSDLYNEDGTVTELKLNDPRLKPVDPALAQEQLEWLTARMKASTADYLWVGGHYPVWAIGQDPPTGVRNILRGLLNTYEAQYFNGHEHDFEHIVEEGSKVNYISTGAGMFCCYADKNLGTVPENSIKFASSGKGGALWWGNVTIPDFEILSGFTSYRIGPDSMKVYYHAHNGTVLYTTPVILPRTKTPQPPVKPPQPMCSDATCPHKERPTGSYP